MKNVRDGGYGGDVYDADCVFSDLFLKIVVVCIDIW